MRSKIDVEIDLESARCKLKNATKLVEVFEKELKEFNCPTPQNGDICRCKWSGELRLIVDISQIKRDLNHVIGDFVALEANGGFCLGLTEDVKQWGYTQGNYKVIGNVFDSK